MQPDYKEERSARDAYIAAIEAQIGSDHTDTGRDHPYFNKAK